MNDFKFEPTTVSENNKTYVLSKNIKAVGPLVPTPYPYYQVEPKEQITEGDLVLFQTTIKPEIQSTNAVQLGTTSAGDVIDLADFVEVTENTTRTLTLGDCLIYISKAETITIVNYIYVKTDANLPDGYEWQMTPGTDGVVKYYKHIQQETTPEPGTTVNVPIGIRFIDKNNNNKLILEIEDDAQEEDGVGNLKTMISTSVVDFDFSAMDVEPTQSINTKKEFKTTK